MAIIQINGVSRFKAKASVRFRTCLADVSWVVDDFGCSVRLADIGELAAKEDLASVAGLLKPSTERVKN